MIFSRYAPSANFSRRDFRFALGKSILEHGGVSLERVAVHEFQEDVAGRFRQIGIAGFGNKLEIIRAVGNDD